jgi:hypothetical protein
MMFAEIENKKDDTELCEWLRASSSGPYWLSQTHLHVAPSHQAASRIEGLLARNAQLEDMLRELIETGEHDE